MVAFHPDKARSDSNMNTRSTQRTRHNPVMHLGHIDMGKFSLIDHEDSFRLPRCSPSMFSQGQFWKRQYHGTETEDQCGREFPQTLTST